MRNVSVVLVIFMTFTASFGDEPKPETPQIPIDQLGGDTGKNAIVEESILQEDNEGETSQKPRNVKRAPKNCSACAMGLTAEFVCQRLDVDEDEFVTASEFRRSPGMNDPLKAREVVARLDNSGDGKLSFEELKAAYEARHAECKKPDAATIEANSKNRFAYIFILRSDQNGDGKVSKEEFRGPLFGFDRLDKNQNGFIEAGELGVLPWQSRFMPLGLIMLVCSPWVIAKFRRLWTRRTVVDE